MGGFLAGIAASVGSAATAAGGALSLGAEAVGGAASATGGTMLAEGLGAGSKALGEGAASAIKGAGGNAGGVASGIGDAAQWMTGAVGKAADGTIKAAKQFGSDVYGGVTDAFDPNAPLKSFDAENDVNWTRTLTNAATRYAAMKAGMGGDERRKRMAELFAREEEKTK